MLKRLSPREWFDARLAEFEPVIREAFLKVSLDLGYGPSMVFFTWVGSDEGGRSRWGRFGRIARRRLDRNHLHLSQQRRSHPQIQTGYFFNNLLEAFFDFLGR